MIGDLVGAVSDCSEALRLDPELDWVQAVRLEARRALVAQGRQGDGERRDRGNENFKRGKLTEAIVEYSLAVANKEERWVLSLSNRAICHLRLGEYTQALADVNACLEQDVTILKAHFTLFKALAALGKWLEAFSALRKLRELPSTTESNAASEQEECAKRREFAQFLEAGCQVAFVAEEDRARSSAVCTRGEAFAQ